MEHAPHNILFWGGCVQVMCHYEQIMLLVAWSLISILLLENYTILLNIKSTLYNILLDI